MISLKNLNSSVAYELKVVFNNKQGLITVLEAFFSSN